MNRLLSVMAIVIAVDGGVSFWLGDWPWGIFCLAASGVLAVMSEFAPR